MKRTADAARGKWKGVLLTLGMARSHLTGKHGPCPVCEGKDRFRFDDKEGQGTFICSQCGAGHGFRLLELWKGWDFRTAAAEVDKIVGRVQPEPAKPRPDPDKQRGDVLRLWKSGAKVLPTDPVGLYLTRRDLPLPQNTDALRFVPSCPVPHEAGGRMAMVAKIAGADGQGVNLHRTFLTPHGSKADMPNPRAVMPGTIPDGSAIRLSMHGDRLGIAEGIETALAASKRFGLPVWAAISSTMLAKWTPPEGVREVMVFGDSDDGFGGQAAAYALAHRLKVRLKLAVEVRIPGALGKDWADADAA